VEHPHAGRYRPRRRDQLLRLRPREVSRMTPAGVKPAGVQ
jgi:hypothetical protein